MHCSNPALRCPRLPEGAVARGEPWVSPGRGAAAPGSVVGPRRLVSVIRVLALARDKICEAVRAASQRLAHSRLARWSQTCASWLVWPAAACGSAAAAAAWLLRLSGAIRCFLPQRAGGGERGWKSWRSVWPLANALRWLPLRRSQAINRHYIPPGSTPADS